MNVISKILYNEMHQNLEDLSNSVNQHFPNDKCMTLENFEWVKRANGSIT